MKHIRILAVMALPTLAACSMMGDKPTATAALSHAECATLHPSTKGNFVAQANCLTSDENTTTSPALDADLRSGLQAKRLSLAQSADSGLITADSYTSQLHKLEAQTASQQQGRKVRATVQ